jgi:hypothetical protein
MLRLIFDTAAVLADSLIALSAITALTSMFRTLISASFCGSAYRILARRMQLLWTLAKGNL